jgi:hypothetical protein
VCDIPCYITKIGIYHLLYTNHDWYIPVMVGISHDPTFQMTAQQFTICSGRSANPNPTVHNGRAKRLRLFVGCVAELTSTAF